jgi:Na+/melibiose symporter-like transporter
VNKHAKAEHKEPSTRTAVALIASLLIVSTFPIYVTSVLSLPPEPGLIITLVSIGVFNLIGLSWLYAALNSLNPSS